MSRLYDRVMAYGCEPLTAWHLIAGSSDPDELRRAAEAYAAEELGRHPSRQEVDEHMARTRRVRERQVLDGETFESAHFDGAVVISAEEVADFWATLPPGTNTTDVTDRLAPPFERMFVEFQGRKNEFGLTSWGVLIQGTAYERAPQAGFNDQGWELICTLVGEWDKAKPIGPFRRWIIPLDSAGYPYSGDEDGLGTFFAWPMSFAGEAPPKEVNIDGALNALLGPALFAVSLMHCKNVDVRPVDPPNRLSKKHQRKHAHPLTRYYVLDIEAMESVLRSEGEVQARGLKHALHICRGHFKTFTEDSPLFGKHTGTYWWASQVRGKPERGVVEKDYRIRLDQGLGREYVEADEHAEIKPDAPEHTGLDPDLGGRGLRAHNITQNLLAHQVRAVGYEPRRPKPDEPQYDLAWDAGEVTWVAEVKSISPRNEERQLRLALGQVIRYRQLLEEEGRTVRAMIVAEREPSDATWAELCERESIALGWPGAFAIE